MSNRINDQYTDLPISRQRKWQLRNGDRFGKMVKDYREKNKEKIKESYKKASKYDPERYKKYRRNRLEYVKECTRQLKIILELYDI